jgi:3-oxoacyl-[acyl-carrier protein] reductase
MKGAVRETRVKVDLEDRVALVTGAARGIGRATADRLAASGGRIVYADIDGADAVAAAGNGDRHLGLRMDVTSEAEVDAAMAAIKERYGRLDILVNNAGIGSKPHERVDIDELPREVWDRMLAVDLTGPFLVSRAAAKLMIPTGSGRIVNIASVVGLVPLRLQSAYVAAKAGVVNLTKSMALELAKHGILVNAVAPGSTATDGWRNWIDDHRPCPHRRRRLDGRILPGLLRGARTTCSHEGWHIYLYMPASRRSRCSGLPRSS